MSSFEDGYVALTRARQQARIYIIEGSQPDVDNDELTHAVPESRQVGIADIAQALGRRRSGHMVADASPDLDSVAQTLVGASLAQLAARRRQLEDLIRRARADVSPAIERAQLTIESIRARQRAWTELLRTCEAESVGPQASRSGRGPAGRDADRARAALEAVDRAHVNMSARLDRAERRQDLRDEWFERHADLIDARELVTRAERAREIQVRVAAINNPDSAVRDLLGPEPLTNANDLPGAARSKGRLSTALATPDAPASATAARLNDSSATGPRATKPPAPTTSRMSDQRRPDREIDKPNPRGRPRHRTLTENRNGVADRGDLAKRL